MTDSIDLGGNGGGTFQWGGQGTNPGAFVVGKVLALAEVQATDYTTKQPETWDNGDPKMQYRVTLQTDLRDPANAHDAGVRDVYLDGSRKVRDNGTKSRLCAVLEAVRAVTGGTALQVGGHLRLQWVSGMGFSGDPRNYEAQYQAPAAPQVELGGPATPAPAPAVQAPPPGWAAPAPSVAVPPVQAATGVATGGTGQEIYAAPGVPTPEQVAAVIAGGMDPAVVWPGVVLPA